MSVNNASLAQNAVALPEITIFGEKLARPNDDVTTSVGVVTGERIQQEQILDLQGAINSTANALVTRSDQNNGGITIRGINSEGLSQNQNAAAAPVISVVVDGATQNAEAVRRGIRSVWDVQQVEILRGPQSTLQGRNSLAGAVFVKTNDPVFNVQAAGQLTAATHNLYSTALMLNAPIVNNELAVRFAGELYRANKDITYTDPRNDPLGEDRFGNARGKILWEPAALPGFRALFTIAHTDDRPGVNAVTGPDFFARVYGTSAAFIDFRATKTNNYVSDLSYALWSNVKLRSITSFAETNTSITSAPGNTTYVRDDTRTGGDFTQDLRLEIENPGNGLSGVLGVFYGRFINKTLSDIDADIGLGLMPIQDLNNRNQTNSLAAYADLRYRIDRWVLIAGGRALRDEVNSRSVGTVFDFGGLVYVPVNQNTDASFNAFLPKVGVTYDLTPTQTVGFTFQQGYRAGFSEIVTGTSTLNRVNPEYMNAYEISYRSRWLDNRLDFNVNVFYYDYTDQQIAIPVPGFPGVAQIVNGGKSHSYGAEFETRFKLTERFTAYTSLGLLFTRFDDFVTSTGNFNGNEFPEAPSFTANVGGLYKHPVGWFAGANARFIDGYYSNTDVANTPIRYVGSATIVDARAGWEFNSSTLTFFAKNLFDEHYLTSIVVGATAAGVGDSRQFGVSWAFRY